jgi:cytochrome d ubiquinol oxidase subunit I
MEILPDAVFLSRLQFAVTAMFHILWPVATVGLSLTLVPWSSSLAPIGPAFP